MTTANPRSIPTTAPRAHTPALEARWAGLARLRGSHPTGTAHGARHALVIALQPERDSHGWIEAWIERDDRRDQLHSRRAAHVDVCVRDGLLHLQAFDATDRTAGSMLTMTISAPGLSDGCTWEQAAALVQRESRLLYVRTPLVAAAGLSAGRSDPPVLRICPAEA